ncbi:MAG: GNAT family N-acetyltransferase [Acidobacteriota bacterium]|nr:GNAT family N-acetyltransferase [Acidobacteriota bacterium]
MSTIRTKRLLLRPYSIEDRDDYISLVTDPLVMAHIDGDVASEEVAEDWWQRLIGASSKDLRWSVRALVDGHYVGHGMINYSRPGNACELGYILARAEWGSGFATEIAGAMADYSRDIMKLKEIFATVDEDHPASRRVLEKVGMEFYGYDFDDVGRYLVYVLNHEG